MVIGYKCFKKGLISQYGDVFEVDKEYHDDGDIKFQHNGFHMCANLEDTLRYFDAFNENIDIASVIGYGVINKYDDEYNEFFDMYAVEYLKICCVLSREEIINYALSLPVIRLKRFLTLFKHIKDELKLFQEKFYNENIIMETIKYYQDENSKVYVKKKKIV